MSQDIYSVLLGDTTCGISSNLDPSSVMVYMTSGNDATKAAADMLSSRGVTVITPDASGKKEPMQTVLIFHFYHQFH